MNIGFNTFLSLAAGLAGMVGGLAMFVLVLWPARRHRDNLSLSRARAGEGPLSGVGFFRDRVPMRLFPHPPSPLLPVREKGEPLQIPLPDAVRSPSPAQV
jgi:hypothetical protein